MNAACDTVHQHYCSALQAALSRGLLPDDETLKQLVLDPDLPFAGRDISTLRWPEEPLRYVLTSEWTPPQHQVFSPLSLWLPDQYPVRSVPLQLRVVLLHAPLT